MTRSRTQRLRLPRAGRRERAALRLESLEDRTLLDGSGQVVVNHPEAILRPTYGVQGPLPPDQPVPVVTPDGPQGGGGGGRLGPIPANVLVNDPTEDRSSPHDTQSETSLGLGPDNTLLVAYNDSFDNGHRRFTGYSLSNDDGNTFRDAHVLPSSTFGDAGDPVVARDNVTGRVYFATLAYTSITNLNVFHSDDGIHFSAPVNGDPGHSGAYLDKEWLTVDNAPGTEQGTVYLVVRDFGSGNGIYLTRSTDQGLTFNTDWVQVASAGSGNVQGAWVTVGPDHTVYAFWYDASTATQKIMMRKSTDQGHTFGPAVTVATLRTTGTNGDLGVGTFRSNAFPQAVVNPANNNLYVTFDDKGTGAERADVFFTQSTDGGATWSPEVKVNDNTTTTDAWQPALAVTPSGSDVGIFWYDRRNDPSNNLIDRYGAVGAVSGNTVVFGPNMRISDTSFPPAFGHDPAVNPVYMGDYDQAVASPTAFYTTWGDNRSPSLGHTGNNQDVRIAKIPVVVAGGAVISSTPSGNTFGAVSSLRVTFDEQMDPTSFTPGQIDSFTAPDGSAIAISDVQAVAGSNDTAFDISFAQQTMLGHYTLVLGPHILDSQGREMDQNGNGIPGEVPDDEYTASFTLQGPKITASTPTGNANLPGAVSSLRVTFNQPMDPSTFGTGAVSLTGPGGAVTVNSVTPVAGSNNTQFDIGVSALGTTGVYTLTVGPNIQNPFGIAMDQDGDFLPDGDLADAYTTTFGVLGPKITASTPTGNSQPGVLSSVRVTFNESMDPNTFGPAAVVFTDRSGNQVPITSVTPVSGTNNTQFDIHFAPLGTTSLYTMVIGPDVRDPFGNEMDQNGNLIPGEIPGDQYTTMLGVLGPKITSSSPTLVFDTNPISQIQVTFSEPMDPTTFTPAQIASFTGPNGAITVTDVQPVAGSNNTQFNILFPAQNTDGTYMMVIGPDIRDPFGNQMDQNGNLIPGEIPGDQFTATFTVRAAPPPLGPDGFGYTAFAIGGTPIDILNKPGTFTIIQDADDLSVPVDLGTHTFNFYGVRYTGNNQLYVSSNGLISFGVSDAAYVNTDLTTSPTEPVIAPLWADWDKLSTDPTGPMVIGKYITYNGSPALVIEWNQVQHYPGGSGFGHLTFQAVLVLDTGSSAGDIGFNYLNLASGDSWAEGNNATAGIKANGSQGANRLLANFTGTSAYVHTGQALMFTTGANSPDVSTGGLLSARPDQLATSAPVAVPTAPGNLAPTPVAPSLVPVDQDFAAAAGDQVPLALAAVGDDSLIAAAGLADALSASGAKDSGVL
jgi:hypothetical protein